MLSAAAASKAATEASVGKAEAAEPRAEKSWVAKAEASEAWAEKAAAEPAIPASAKSDGNPDGPSPSPWIIPSPRVTPAPSPLGYPRPNSTVSTHCPTEGRASSSRFS